VIISSTLSIINFIEENYPNPALYPHDIQFRADALALVEMIKDVNTTIVTIKNVIQDTKRNIEIIKSLENTLSLYEDFVKHRAGIYSLGDQITLPDCFLFPLMEFAMKQGMSLTTRTTLLRIYEHLLKANPFLSESLFKK